MAVFLSFMHCISCIYLRGE